MHKPKVEEKSLSPNVKGDPEKMIKAKSSIFSGLKDILNNQKI